MGGINYTVQPTENAVTLNELKLHLRVDHAYEDVLIDSLNKAAERYVENVLWRQLVTATVQYYLDWREWLHAVREGVIRLPLPPVQSVTAVNYLDQAGAQQTLLNTLYHTDTFDAPAKITRVDGVTWPEVDERPNTVWVTMVCGYGDKEDVPETIKTAIKLLAAHWFVHRESVVVGTTSAEIEQTLNTLLMSERFDFIGEPRP